MLIREQKAALRRALLDKRRALSESEKQLLEGRLNEILKSAPEILEADLVLLYAAVRGELDLAPLAEELLRRGVAVAYPRSHPGGILSFHTVPSLHALERGMYGIPEPPPDAPEATPTPRSVCIVPALAYDKSGYRLGYGGGYYDRFLGGFCGNTIGVAPKYALMQELMHEQHDLRVHAVATENGIQTTFQQRIEV